MLPRRTITSDWSWYILSVIKKEKRVFWLFERGIGIRRYCKERIIKRRASGELPVRDTLVLCDWGRITP